MFESTNTLMEPPAPAPSRAPAPAPANHPARRLPGARVAIALLALAGIGAAVYSGIHSRTLAEAESQRVALDTLAANVQVIHPQKGAKAEEIALPGNTQAFSDTAIYARTSGYLKTWNVDIGAHVKQDQVLAEIETPEVDQQLEQAEADLKNAQANLELSKITAGRWETLYKRDVVSHQERDQTASDFDSKTALVAADEANVRRLKKLQSFEKVYAPFDGIITARNTDVGSLIQAGENTTAKELFHIASTKTLRVYVSVPEVYAASVKTGDQVGVTFDTYPSGAFTGAVVRNSGSIDQRSRTLNVEVDVENPKEVLYPGGYAIVKFKLPPGADSFTIPSNTLLFRSEGLRVAVVRAGHVELVPISIGHDFGSSVEVLSGVTSEDAIVLDPSDSLAQGAAVHIESAAAQAKVVPARVKGAANPR